MNEPYQLGSLIAYCYRHERMRPGLRVVRRCAQRQVRRAYQRAGTVESAERVREWAERAMEEVEAAR